MGRQDKPAPAKPAEALDLEILHFTQLMGAEWAKHPPLDSVPVTEARRIADKVRATFAQGGPKMARTTEKRIPLKEGSVRIRVLDPGEGGPKPALIYLHGGGWTIFSIDTHDRLMREYAARANVVVIAVDYTLSPEVRFPRAIDETLTVVRWLQSDGQSIGVDANRIAVGGDSAGAAMTLSVAMLLRDAGEPNVVKAMLLNYGSFDAECDTDSYARYGEGGFMWGHGEMYAFWNNYLGDATPRTHPLACPIHADVHGLPPAFLCIPECDVMFDEELEMAEKLRKSGVRTTSVIYPGATHSFLEAVSVAKVTRRAFDDAARWLTDMLI